MAFDIDDSDMPHGTPYRTTGRPWYVPANKIPCSHCGSYFRPLRKHWTTCSYECSRGGAPNVPYVAREVVYDDEEDDQTE